MWFEQNRTEPSLSVAIFPHATAKTPTTEQTFPCSNLIYPHPHAIPVISQSFMAGAGAPVMPQAVGSAAVNEVFKHSRSRHVFSIPVSSRNGYSVAFEPLLAQGPSCLFVGPVETASKETLEALYCQARDSYYNGSPLIIDDMFDRVELKLRWYGSKYVVKYPRCSLRKQSTYADAEEDPSQVFALASLWILILVFGGSVCLVPITLAIVQAYHDAFHIGATYVTQTSVLMYIVMGSLIGYPIASASVAALQEIWKNDLVALKGVCPNCGEEVFAFVRAKQSNKSPHKSECHVCESFLEFRTTVEQSITRPSRQWVHGRVYLIR